MLMFHGGWRGSHLWVETFICCVVSHHTSTSVVRTFHHTTAATENVRWWVLEWDLSTSRSESLLSTVLVLRSDLFQAAPRPLR